MNAVLTAAIVVFTAVAAICGFVALATRKILDRIAAAVEHLEQHAEQERNTTYVHDGDAASPPSTDLAGFFAPPAQRER